MSYVILRVLPPIISIYLSVHKKAEPTWTDSKPLSRQRAQNLVPLSFSVFSKMPLKPTTTKTKSNVTILLIQEFSYAKGCLRGQRTMPPFAIKSKNLIYYEDSQ